MNLETTINHILAMTSLQDQTVEFVKLIVGCRPSEYRPLAENPLYLDWLAENRGRLVGDVGPYRRA